MHEHWKQCNVCSQGKWVLGSALVSGVWWPGIALRLMTWTNNFSKTFFIFASLIPFFWLIIPEKCFYQ